jgi:hypothetical protein
VICQYGKIPVNMRFKSHFLDEIQVTCLARGGHIGWVNHENGDFIGSCTAYRAAEPFGSVFAKGQLAIGVAQ